MEVAVRKSPGFSWVRFAFACSIAVACAGAAAGAQGGGGHGAGGQNGGGHGAGSDKGGGHGAGGQRGKGGAHKGAGDDRTSTSAATAVSVVPSVEAGQSPGLPPALQPPGNSPSTVSPIKALPGVPDEVVRACRDAIEVAAAPFGATSVRVSSAGFLRQVSPDMISAPIKVSIDYGRPGNVETRQAPIKCELNAKGSVIGLT